MKNPHSTTRTTAWIHAFEIRKPRLCTAAGITPDRGASRRPRLSSSPQQIPWERRTEARRCAPSFGGEMSAASVLIVDRVTLVRRALREMLRGDGDLAVVAEAADLPHAVAALHEHRP